MCFKIVEQQHTWLPICRTTATPSFPATAGSGGLIGYLPSIWLMSDGLMGACSRMHCIVLECAAAALTEMIINQGCAAYRDDVKQHIKFADVIDGPVLQLQRILRHAVRLVH